MTSSITPRRSVGYIEPLEARIAPATMKIGYTGIGVDADNTEYVDHDASAREGKTATHADFGALNFVNIADGSVNGGPANPNDQIAAALWIRCMWRRRMWLAGATVRSSASTWRCGMRTMLAASLRSLPLQTSGVHNGLEKNRRSLDLSSVSARVAGCRRRRTVRRVRRADHKMWASEPNWTDAQLQAIRSPVLVVDGDHDEAIKRAHTEYIAATIHGAGLLSCRTSATSRSCRTRHCSMRQCCTSWTEHQGKGPLACDRTRCSSGCGMARPRWRNGRSRLPRVRSPTSRTTSSRSTRRISAAPSVSSVRGGPGVHRHRQA